MSRPRVIRKVVQRDRKGNPKVARDLRLGVDMTRVTARAPRPCGYPGCPIGGRIAADVAYAKVLDRDNPRTSIRIRDRLIPQPVDYHFICVPPHTRPLVRFLHPRLYAGLLVSRNTKP